MDPLPKEKKIQIYTTLCSPSGNIELIEHELLKINLSKSHQYCYRQTPTSVKKLLAFQSPICDSRCTGGTEPLPCMCATKQDHPRTSVCSSAWGGSSCLGPGKPLLPQSAPSSSPSCKAHWAGLLPSVHGRRKGNVQCNLHESAGSPKSC